MQPGVIKWFKIYAAFLLLLYVLIAIMGIVLSFSDLIPSETPDEAVAVKVSGVLYAGIGAVFAAVFAVGLFTKNQPWAWVYNLVLICIGLASCLFLPAAIPMLIHWLKPETKAWYQRS